MGQGMGAFVDFPKTALAKKLAHYVVLCRVIIGFEETFELDLGCRLSYRAVVSV